MNIATEKLLLCDCLRLGWMRTCLSITLGLAIIVLSQRALPGQENGVPPVLGSSIAPLDPEAEAIFHLLLQLSDAIIDGEVELSAQINREVLDRESKVFGEQSSRIAWRHRTQSLLQLKLDDLEGAMSEADQYARIVALNHKQPHMEIEEAERFCEFIRVLADLPTEQRLPILDGQSRIEMALRSDDTIALQTVAEANYRRLVAVLGPQHLYTMAALATVEYSRATRGQSEGVAIRLQDVRDRIAALSIVPNEAWIEASLQLAVHLFILEQYSDAKRLATDLVVKMQGANLAETNSFSNCWNVVALCHNELNEPQQAVAAFIQAADWKRKSRDVSRWSYLVVLDNLAQNQLRECVHSVRSSDIPAARKAVEGYRETLSEILAKSAESPEIRAKIRTSNFWQHTIELLASTKLANDGKLQIWSTEWKAIEDLMNQSQWREAALKATAILPEIERDFGKDNLLAIEIRMLLAYSSASIERAGYFRSIEPIVLEWLGDTHPYYARCLLAYADDENLSLEQRIDYASQAAEIYLGSNRFRTADYAYALAKVGDLASSSDRDLAISSLDLAAEVLRSRGQRVSAKYADVCRSLALLHQSRSEKFTAQQLIEEAISIAKQIEKFDANTLAVYLHVLANCEIDLGKLEAALKHYGEALNLIDASSTFARDYGLRLRLSAAICARRLKYYELAISYLQSTIQSTQGEYSEIAELFNCGIELVVNYRLTSQYERALIALDDLAKKVECTTESLARWDFQRHDGATNLSLVDRALNIDLQKVAVFRDMERIDDCLVALRDARQICDVDFLRTLEPAMLLKFKRASSTSIRVFADTAKHSGDVELQNFFQKQYYRLLEIDDQTSQWDLLNARLDVSDSEKLLAMTPQDRERLAELRKIKAESAVDVREIAQVAKQKAYIDQLSQLLGEDNREVLRNRLELADAFQFAGDYRSAAAHYELLLQDYIACLGAIHPSVASCEKSLAICYRQLGKSDAATELFERSVVHAEAIFGAESVELADCLHSTAINLFSANKFTEALTVVNRIVSIYENSSSSETFNFASVLRTQFAIYDKLGDAQRASDALSRSHNVIKSIYGVNTLEYADSLTAGAIVLCRDPGESRKMAEEMFNQAIDIYRHLNMLEHPNFADLLNNYGNLLSYDKRYLEAIDSYRRCLELRKKLFGASHPAVAQAHSQIGSMALNQGNLQLAKAELELAFETWTIVYEDNNIELERNSHQRAVVAALLGDTPEAWGHAVRAASIQNSAIDQAVLAGSQAGINELLEDSDETTALLIELASSPGATTEWIDKAFQTTLSRKGLALDAACLRQSAAREQMQNLQVQKILTEIQQLHQKLAGLAVDDELTSSEIEAQSNKIYNKIADANEVLSRHLNQEMQNLLRDVSLTDLRGRLREEETLVEYVVLPRINHAFAKEDRQTAKLFVGNELYAFVLGRNSPAKLLDLGDYDGIQVAIENFRKQIIQTPRQLRINDEQTLAKSIATDSHFLYEQLIAPIRSEVSDFKNLVVSPDKDLYFVPFAALNVNEDRYLIEDTAISYLTSARDLTRPLNPVGRKTLLLANPDFDHMESVESTEKEPASSPTAQIELLASLQRDMDLRSLRWKSLPGAEKEATRVMELLNGTSYGPVLEYRGERAAEEVFKQAVMPRIIHLATHGFYFPEKTADEKYASDETSNRSLNRMGQLRLNQNPLLRSGLVLAGANLSLKQSTAIVGREDGWLTAQEISGMDFSSTELIVLSACESGLGKVEDGEGVQGLRRSFTVAGAHSLLTSLFSVPDDETNELMVHFYESFIGGTSKVESIRQAQLALIRERRSVHKAAHPFFWSSFILVGDPR